ncbi:DUF1769-domain-containing protein [Meredithblackwellia eburnea MCA 4105]
MPKLRVSIGPDRFHQVIANVNDISHPVEINTPLFVGRCLVYVKDFSGVTPDGSPPIRESSYFDGRSRKFAILIEGRFKKREGVEPYTADEIHFGSDFERLPESFPHGPFNAGMRIARMVDPATFFDEHPPSGRPYIMSPYAACMNTLCGYPAPSALSRAVLLAHHDAAHPHHAGEESRTEDGFVPHGEIEGAKGARIAKNRWRFVGLQGDPKVDQFVLSHSHLLPNPSRSTAHASSEAHSTAPHPHAEELGTSSHTLDTEPEHEHEHETDPTNTASRLWGAIPVSRSDSPAPAAPAPTKAKSRFSLATLTGRGGSSTPAHVLGEGDLVSGESFKNSLIGTQMEGNSVEALLGPWRFGKDGVDAMEDTTFVFLDPEQPRTVAQRRKHFVTDGGKHRKELVYDPDVVYTTSFFTNFCDLNTFELRMGPVHLNIAKYFTDMPIRYTLRSTRLGPRPDGAEGAPQEEECFVTIAFELVD